MNMLCKIGLHHWRYYKQYDDFLRRDIYVYCVCEKCDLARATSLDGDKIYDKIDDVQEYLSNMNVYRNEVMAW